MDERYERPAVETYGSVQDFTAAIDGTYGDNDLPD